MVKNKFRVKMSSPLLTILFLFFILLPIASAYQIDTYNVQTQSASTITAYAPAFYSPDLSTCSVSSQIKGTSSGSSFSFNTLIYSPAQSVVASNSLSNQNPFSCRVIATHANTLNSNKGTNDTYEMGALTSTSGSSGFLQINQRTLCDDTGVTSINLFHNHTDSRGLNYVSNILRDTNNLKPEDIVANYTACSSASDLNLVTYNLGITSCAGDATCGGSFIMPFNSSGGNISIDIKSPYSCVGNIGTTRAFSVYLADSSGDITTLDFTDISSCSGSATYTYSGEVSLLDYDELYFIILRANATHPFPPGSYSFTASFPTEFHLTIDNRKPEYTNCTEYSDCLNGTQTRTCTDQSPYGFPNIIESRFCTGDALFTENFGFEEFTDIQVYECEYSTLCGYEAVLSTRKIPTNWDNAWNSFTDITQGNTTQYFNHYYELNAESKASPGSGYALKMWSISPGVHVVPVGGTPTCQNSTSIGNLATLNRRFNDSVALNLSFDTEYARISYDVKALDNPYIHASPPWWCVFNEETCYGDCDADITPRYLISIYDDTDTLLNEVDTALSSWGLRSYDLSGTGLEPGKNYTIEIALDVQGSGDANQYGIYMDNLRVEESNAPILCESECDGRDLIQAVELPTGACKIQTIVNESSCVAIVEAEEAEVEQQQYEAGSWLEDILIASGTNSTAIEESGFGGALFFASPFGLALIFMFAISTILELLNKSGGIVFGLSIMGLSLGMSIAGIFPLVWAILFMLLGGFVLAFHFRKMVGGG